MSNCNEHKTSCGDNTFNARCTRYNGEIPTWSELHDQDCNSLEDVVEDLYGEISDIKEQINFSDLTSECLDLEQDGETTPKSVAEALTNAVGELYCEKDEIKANDLLIGCMNLDFKCLVDSCGKTPEKLSELLQLIIDKLPCE
jgi:hypothetical protein